MIQNSEIKNKYFKARISFSFSFFSLYYFKKIYLACNLKLNMYIAHMFQLIRELTIKE